MIFHGIIIFFNHTRCNIIMKRNTTSEKEEGDYDTDPELLDKASIEGYQKVKQKWKPGQNIKKLMDKKKE